MGITVFVSYSTKDKELFQIKWFAEQLAKKPKIDDVLYWEEDAHGSIIDYMNKNVPACDVFILFCSPNILASKPIQVEWETAQYYGKEIIPIFQVIDYVPPILKRLRGISFHGIDHEGTLNEVYQEILQRSSGISSVQLDEETIVQGEKLVEIDRKVLSEIETLLGKQFPNDNMGKYALNFGYRTKNGKITELGLYTCGLNALPDSIGNLSSLRSLNIRYNHLTELPDSFMQLDSLEDLGLGGNNLKKIPWYFNKLRALRYIDLSGNPLTNLPLNLLELPQLHRIKIDEEKLDTQGKDIIRILREKGTQVMHQRPKASPEEIRKLFSDE